MSTLGIAFSVTDAAGNSASAAATAEICPVKPTSYGAASNYPNLNGQQSWDALTAALGHQPGFMHGYSGLSIPTSFSSSSVARAQALGIGAMLNVKSDWLAGGDPSIAGSKMAALTKSWPGSVPGWIIVNHEPENNTVDPQTNMQQALAQAASWRAHMEACLTAFMANVGSKPLSFGRCMMEFDFEGSSSLLGPENWEPNWAQSQKDAVVYFIDAYPKMHADGTFVSVAQKAIGHSWARQHGYSRVGFAEFAFNNDAMAPESAVGSAINSLRGYCSTNSVEACAYYNSEGPAAGTNARLTVSQARLGAFNSLLSV